MQEILFREEKLIDRENERRFIKEWFEKVPKEILFFEPSNNQIYANSRVYEKAFERFIK